MFKCNFRITSFLVKTTSMIISLLVFFCLQSCQPANSSSKVEPKLAIHRINYYIRYLELNRELQAEARF